MLVNIYQLTQCHIQTDNILYYTFLHGITEQSTMHCIMTQEQTMSNSTVKRRNTSHLSRCVTVQIHSEKAVCTNHGIWLSLDTATTALSRMIAKFKRAYMYFNFLLSITGNISGWTLRYFTSTWDIGRIYVYL